MTATRVVRVDGVDIRPTAPVVVMAETIRSLGDDGWMQIAGTCRKRMQFATSQRDAEKMIAFRDSGHSVEVVILEGDVEVSRGEWWVMDVDVTYGFVRFVEV